jgi:DNA-binding helix-hairpin-helix protein with protein kinase domain
MNEPVYYVPRNALIYEAVADMANFDDHDYVKVRLASTISERHAEELSRVHSHLVVLSEQQEAIMALLKKRARRRRKAA